MDGDIGYWVRVVGEVHLVVDAAGDGVARPRGGGEGEERHGAAVAADGGVGAEVVGVPIGAVDADRTVVLVARLRTKMSGCLQVCNGCSRPRSGLRPGGLRPHPRACLAVGQHRDLGRLAWRSPACAEGLTPYSVRDGSYFLPPAREITLCRSVLSQRATEPGSSAPAKDAPGGRGRRAPHGRSAHHGGSPRPACASREIFRLAGRRTYECRRTYE